MKTRLLSRFVSSSSLNSASAAGATTALPWISPLQHRSSKSNRRPTPPPSSHGDEPTTGSIRPSSYITHDVAIQMISRSSDPQDALDIFNRAGSQRGFSHNNDTYSAVLRRLALSRMFSAVDALLRCMSQEPCRFHESTLLGLMPHYARAGLPERVLSLFFDIPSLVRSNPSPKALATCLDSLLADSDRPDLAKALLSDSQRRFNLEPNTCVRNILVKYHCRKKDLGKAFLVLEEMRSSTSARPNLVTYSTLMGGLCTDGRMKEAFQLFEEMIERDGIYPDALAFNVLITGFCRNNMVDKARQVLGFMRSAGCEPNMFNYTALMQGLCKEGRIDEAKEVFDEIRAFKREVADAVSYTTLIGCLCKSGRTDEGIALVWEMTQKGCRPDAVTVNQVLGGLCAEGRATEAVRLLERAPLEDVKVNRASYRIVLNKLIAEEEIGRASELLKLMLARGVFPHFAASNGLLIGLCTAEKVVDATESLFGLMETGFLPEEETWVRLVETVCRERKTPRVVHLLDELVAGSET